MQQVMAATMPAKSQGIIDLGVMSGPYNPINDLMLSHPVEVPVADSSPEYNKALLADAELAQLFKQFNEWQARTTAVYADFATARRRLLQEGEKTLAEREREVREKMREEYTPGNMPSGQADTAPRTAEYRRQADVALKALSAHVLATNKIAVRMRARVYEVLASVRAKQYAVILEHKVNSLRLEDEHRRAESAMYRAGLIIEDALPTRLGDFQSHICKQVADAVSDGLLSGKERWLSDVNWDNRLSPPQYIPPGMQRPVKRVVAKAAGVVGL